MPINIDIMQFIDSFAAVNMCPHKGRWNAEPWGHTVQCDSSDHWKAPLTSSHLSHLLH